MPLIKYFGVRTKEFGRPLWEIVLNLKNFGRGRYVQRSIIAERYPKEPCFYKILSVHPHFIEYPENFQGNIFVEEVFRGVPRKEPVDIGDVAGTSGFRLVLKEDEPKLIGLWKEYQAKPPPLTVLPKTAPLPPLWREILAKERGCRPEDIPEIPVIHDPIEPGVGEPRRVAEAGESPTFKIGPGNWQPMFPQFLMHAIKSRDAAREKLCSKIPDPDFIYVDKKLEPVDISDLLPKTQDEAASSNLGKGAK